MSSINAKARADNMRFKTKNRNTIQAFTREVLLEIGYRLVYRSAVGNPDNWHPPYWPKGYIPGHFINNWQVGIDRTPNGIIAEVDSSGRGSYDRLGKLGRWPAGHTYYFVNNLPYASLLESGLHSSQVGPGGMVALTTMEFPSIVREVENKVR